MPKKIILLFLTSFIVNGFFLFFPKILTSTYALSCTGTGECNGTGTVCYFGTCYYNGMTCDNGCSNGASLTSCRSNPKQPPYDSCSSIGLDSGGQSFCCYNPVSIPTQTPTPVPGNCARQEQCNETGTGWDIVTTNACIAPSSCGAFASFVCGAPTPTPIPTATPTPTPIPFNCSGVQYGLQYGCFTSCPYQWNSSIYNPNTTCSASQPTCCYYNPPPTSTPTPTPTITPTPTPSCPDHSSCSACINGAPYDCGWTTSPSTTGNFCRSGTDSTCPAGNTSWYWDSCSTNKCVAPTATPTPTPTPTPTLIPCSNWNNCSNCIAVGAGRATDCGWKNGSTCQTGNDKCPAGATTWNYFSCSQDLCAPTSTPTTVPTATLTPTSAPTPTPTSSFSLNSFTGSAACFSSSYTATLSWSGTSLPPTDRDCPNGYWVDISTNNFSTWYNKCVQNTTTIAPAGFRLFPSGSSNLVFQPSTKYYARVFNGFRPLPSWTNTLTLDTPNICPTPTPTVTPTPTPTPTPAVYSLSGKIFNDANGDGDSENGGDTNYTGSVTITRSPALGSFSNSGGNYSYTNLPAGQYTITYSGLPQGFVFTYPDTPLIVNVGSPCSCPVTSEATCSVGTCTSGGSGSISGLNAGVTSNPGAWFQSLGSDVRVDKGYDNPIPSNKYASEVGTGGMPGIIFSGTVTPDYGAGSASSTKWQVSGNNTSISNRDVFTDTHNLIPTSYRFLLETAQASGISPSTISTIDSNLAHGMYKTNGDITINSPVTFGAGDFIILINGNLTINQKIKVPVGSTAIFSATGNITVNRSLGEAASSTVSTIEGLYSADRDFIADGNNDCSLVADRRLNVAGSVIANAGRSGGSFKNNRDMCFGNSSYPSVSFIERPDFILNYPSLTQQTTRAWQDVAP